MRKKHFFALFTVLCSLNYSFGQINAHAKVTAISGTVLTISNVNETYHTFAVGEDIIIMQMQDDVIGDVTNSSTFGVLGSISSAGLYERNTIAAKTATTITLSYGLTNSYNTGANSSVQVISFQELGTGGALNYNTTGDIAALPWDGNVGGVVAMKVTGRLRLYGDITANGAGFRGGAVSGGTNGGVCDNTTFITATTDISGVKGEGIFKRTAGGQQYGRAKILNGGGGGNVHNAGGGGGGNVTSGADGGIGWSCASSAGGQGGISLSTHISKTRVFMGGGGGGGHQNNGIGSAGGNGGGIILISAGSLRNRTGGCSTQTISANGTAAANTGNDGAGGAGAGGSIIFDVGAFDVSPACAVTVTANGGDGGSVNDGASHGGGGGGGQGRVIYSGTNPTNVTTTTNNGTSGCNDTSCGVRGGGSPGGTNGSGISNNNGSTPLPVSLLYFTGAYNTESGKIDLKWATATEQNNHYFTVERSADGSEWNPVIQVPGNGTSSVVNRYQHEDGKIFEKFYYYRLSQTDLDNTTQVLKVIRVESNGEGNPDIWVYPNPAKQSEKITLDLVHLPSGMYTITVYNSQGTEVSRKQLDVSRAFDSTELDVNNLAAGLYTIRINSVKLSLLRKAVVQ